MKVMFTISLTGIKIVDVSELERVSNINPTTTTYPQGLQSLIALDQLLVKQQVELAEGLSLHNFSFEQQIL